MIYMSSKEAIAPEFHCRLGLDSKHQGRLKSLDDSEKGDRDAKDFLTKLALLHRRDQEAYTYWHVFAGRAQNVAAGSETTSITLNSIFYYLMKDPQRLHKLQTEIDEAVQSGQASDPITFAQAQKLPYLQAVIKEGLRMHPATGLPIWRTVPEGGATIAGVEFRAGANVGINSWVAHHNKDVFGEDAALFRPERWLSSTSSPEQLAAMEKYYMPFGLGSRTCIGKNISLLEISKLVPHLIRHYEFRLLTPTWTSFNNWFCKQFNIEVTVSRRQLVVNYEDR
ncbi:cytochrome P450 [Exophiala viscosa]|uniref:Cytochrome P450 n=1 Tax=Exophiala viscosa TaxID=2486360 RepID=A0AAN6IFA0_9EURO|nr:cytochrome P450 [Exophiala viscosa]